MFSTMFSKIKALNAKVGNKAKFIFIGVLTLISVLFLVSMAFKRGLFIPMLVLLGAGCICFPLFKLSLNESGKSEPALRMLYVSAVIIICDLIFGAAFAMGRKLGSYNGLMVPAFMFSFIAVIGMLVFSGSATWKKARTAMVEWDPNKAEEERPKPGDVRLCIDKEASEGKRKPVYEYIRLKDRFLHMLVIGATGTGKTSQILLPMVNQDIANPEVSVIVLEPKGDYAQDAAMLADHYGRDHLYFDPSLAGCPFFNPLIGPEAEVMENMATTFRALNADSPQFFLDQDDHLIRYAIKVLKRLDVYHKVDGKYSNFIVLGRLIQNSGSQGRNIINEFSKITAPSDDEAKENFDIRSWFINDYFAERSKAYENTSEVRSQVAKLNSNPYLSHVLNPDPAKGEYNQIDFDKILADGGVVCFSTAQGLLRDLGRFLGYFIILQLQSAVFRRPGTEDTRRPCFLYIDEFQTYSTKGFSDMLTQGRSYRVGCVLATQAIAQIGMGNGRDGKDFIQLVETNTRTQVLFPGANNEDAKYFSTQFGEYEKEEEMVSTSRKKFNLLTGGLDRLGHPTESVRIQKKMTPNFSVSDLIYRPFGEITYRIMKANTLQFARVGKTEFIPKELHAEIKERQLRYLEEHQFSDEPPKAGTEIAWEDGGDPIDLGNGEEYQPMEEDDIPSAKDLEMADEFFMAKRQSRAEETRDKERKRGPERPVEREQEPRRDEVQELDWDLLDTHGDPEDGFMNDSDDLLG